MAPPAGFAGINATTLSWDANTEPDLAGYEVMMRETTSPDWTSATSVGNVTTVTLNISKDNVQFGLRAVDRAGHRSPVAFPQTVNLEVGSFRVVCPGPPAGQDTRAVTAVAAVAPDLSRRPLPPPLIRRGCPSHAVLAA